MPPSPILCYGAFSPLALAKEEDVRNRARTLSIDQKQESRILAQAKEANRFLRCRIHTISFAQIRDREMRTFVAKLAAENDGKCTWLK